MRRKTLFGMFVTALASGACYSSSTPPDVVFLNGRLIEFVDEETARVISGAECLGTGRDGGPLETEVFDEPIFSGSVSDANGFFSLGNLPPDTGVLMSFTREGMVPAVFAGETARYDSFLFSGAIEDEEDGTQYRVGPYLELPETVQAFIDEFSAAVLGTSGTLMTLGSNGGGAIVRGRVTHLADAETFDFDNVGGATVSVTDAAGNPYAVYYRNAAGEVDPLATATDAADGRWAAFAVVATGAHPVLTRGVGRITVTVTHDGASASEETIVIDGGIAEFDLFQRP